MAEIKIIIGVLLIVVIAAGVFGAYEMEIGPFEEDDDDDDDNGGNGPVADEKPVAIIEVDGRHFDVGQNITFDGSESFDSETNITSYLWDFDDGSTSDNATVDHNMSSAGAYNVTLTVEDLEGNTNSTYILIGITYREDQNGNTNGETDSFNFDLEDMATKIIINTTLRNGDANVGDNDVTLRIYFEGTVVDEQNIVMSGGSGEVGDTYINQTNLSAGTWTWEIEVNDSGLNCDLDWEVEVVIIYA